MNSNICNNCGGGYEYRHGRWICRFCGSYKPQDISNEETTLLYTAFQKVRLAEFDEAEQAFDDIIQKYPENPNAYWGRLMAKYGIKYEQDFDGKMIPTCYAASIESITEDGDYQKALEFADRDNREYYRMQAQYMERVRLEWIEKARKEKPYDIFICYKDSDQENGVTHTEDSNEMMDLYIRLQNKGYRVFFSRVSLTEKGGEKYEPYIFNALSTAKVMIVYGSNPAYITSVWVKNEWTRYGKRIRAGEKREDSLLVAYKGFDPGVLPAALRSRQCFDAGKITFFDDLIGKVREIVSGTEAAPLSDVRKNAFSHAPVAQTAKRAASQGLQYKVNPDRKTCMITQVGACRDTHVVVPGAIDGYTVTGIGKETFRGYSALKSIVLADGITEIGEGAFSGCRGLTSVLIPDGITDIGPRTFCDCRGLTSIRIPSGVARIGDEAFRFCHGLKSVDIPESVKQIGKHAFADCTNLTEIRYEGTENLWDRIVFGPYWRGGSAVRSIAASDGLLGSGGLEYRINGDMQTCTVTGSGTCTDTEIIVPGIIDGYAVTGIGDGAWQYRGDLTGVTLSKGVTVIGNRAFSGCGSLARVEIPEGVTVIGDHAFYGCNNLTAVDIPEGMTVIGDHAFYGCNHLAAVNIPEGVRKIGEYAFSACSLHLGVSIPASVAYIGNNAFGVCKNLTVSAKNIHYASLNGELKSRDPSARKSFIACLSIAASVAAVIPLLVFLCLKNNIASRMMETLLPQLKNPGSIETAVGKVTAGIAVVAAIALIALSWYCELGFASLLIGPIGGAVSYFVLYGIYHLLFWAVYVLLNPYAVLALGGIALLAIAVITMAGKPPKGKYRTGILVCAGCLLAVTLVCFVFALVFAHNNAMNAIPETVSAFAYLKI